MVEGLFLDGVRGDGGDVAVDECVEFAVNVFSRLAEAERAESDLAAAFTEVALRSFIRQFLE